MQLCKWGYSCSGKGKEIAAAAEAALRCPLIMQCFVTAIVCCVVLCERKSLCLGLEMLQILPIIWAKSAGTVPVTFAAAE